MRILRKLPRIGDVPLVSSRESDPTPAALQQRKPEFSANFNFVEAASRVSTP